MASMDLEDGGDELRVYDGPNSSWPLLAALSGIAGELPEPIQSSGGSMTVVFTSDETVQREGFVGAVRSVPAATPSPTVVGYTWAPTTAAPTGPCRMRVRRLASVVPHTRCVVDRRGCDHDGHERRREVELELLERVCRRQGSMHCFGAIDRNEPQLHPSGRSAAERTGDAGVHEPHHHHVGASAAVALRPSLRSGGSRELRRNAGCIDFAAPWRKTLSPDL